MFTRILTDKERKRIQAYMAADGEKTSAVRTIVTRGRQFIPRIEKDLRLLRQLLATYERSMEEHHVST